MMLVGCDTESKTVSTLILLPTETEMPKQKPTAPVQKKTPSGMESPRKDPLKFAAEGFLSDMEPTLKFDAGLYPIMSCYDDGITGEMQMIPDYDQLVLSGTESYHFMVWDIEYTDGISWVAQYGSVWVSAGPEEYTAYFVLVKVDRSDQSEDAIQPIVARSEPVALLIPAVGPDTCASEEEESLYYFDLYDDTVGDNPDDAEWLYIESFEIALVEESAHASCSGYSKKTRQGYQIDFLDDLVLNGEVFIQAKYTNPNYSYTSIIDPFFDAQVEFWSSPEAESEETKIQLQVLELSTITRTAVVVAQSNIIEITEDQIIEYYCPGDEIGLGNLVLPGVIYESEDLTLTLFDGVECDGDVKRFGNVLLESDAPMALYVRSSYYVQQGLFDYVVLGGPDGVEDGFVIISFDGDIVEVSIKLDRDEEPIVEFQANLHEMQCLQFGELPLDQ